MKASLVLEDGTVFEGAPFGKAGEAFGETVFYTGVVGYQEVLTDPAYRGTLVALTYPIIGSYGVTAADNQSARIQAAGVVIRDYSARYSNFRATGALEDLLLREGVTGIQGVDTRALVVHLREKGAMKGAIVPGDSDAKAAAARIKKTASPYEGDLCEDCTFVLMGDSGGRKLAVLDAGAPRALFGQLSDLGLAVLESGADPSKVASAKLQGLLVAGGPGDPRRARRALAALKPLLGRMPVLGLGLGNALVALGLGCAVSRMKVGHHGVNHSVRDVQTGKCIITAQHHGYVVEPKVPGGVLVTHVNVNDETVEGVMSGDGRARGIHFMPARDDMGAPSEILERFARGGNG